MADATPPTQIPDLDGLLADVKAKQAALTSATGQNAAAQAALAAAQAAATAATAGQNQAHTDLATSVGNLVTVLNGLV